MAISPSDGTAVSTALGWQLINKRMATEGTVSLGEANEQLHEKFDISRERQDAFAYRSHQLAQQAWENGFYDDNSYPPAKTPRSLSDWSPISMVRASYVLVGQSTGATVVFMYAQTHPDKVSCFVAMNPVPPQTTFLKAAPEGRD